MEDHVVRQAAPAGQDKVNVYWKNVLTIVPLVMCGLSTIFFILRIICRRFVSGMSIRVEDYLMGIGLLLSYGVTTFTVYTAYNGVGIATKLLPEDEQQRINFGSWMIQKFWAPSSAFIKSSIIVFLNNTIGLSRTFRIAAHTIMAYVILWAVGALLTNIFQCTPISYYYDKTIVGGHCMSGEIPFFQASGSLSLIGDIAILVLPIPVIWNLKLSSKEKIALTCILSLGIFVCSFSLLRLVEFRTFITTDLSSSSAKESIWTALEINVAIICGCLPMMKPLFELCFGRLGAAGSSARSYKPGSNQSSSFRNAYKGTRSDVSWSDKAFQQITGTQSDAWSPSGKAKTQNDNVQSEFTRNSSEIELQGVHVHRDIYQTVEGS